MWPAAFTRGLALPLCLLALAACGGTDGTATSEQSPGGDQGTHSLVIEQSYGPGSGGALYIEGAMADVLLRGPNGREEVQQGDPNKPLTFAGLTAGRYTAMPALRPCNANCGNLDQRTDECSISIDITAASRLAVRYTPTKPCEVEER